MTDEQKFLTALAALAKACQFTMSPELVSFYDEGLAPSGYLNAATAIKQILLTRRGTDRMPSIRDIREVVTPEANPEHEAIEASARIVEAITKCGYCNPLGAEKHIGPLGWQVVQREGGWEALCEKVTTDKVPMYRAQWREQAKAILGRSARGEFSAPALPKPDAHRDAMPSRIGGLLPGMGRDRAAGKDE